MKVLACDNINVTQKLKFDLGKKENIQVTCTFSFSHNVFKSFL